MHLDLPEKRYYRIGEIAKAFDVNASLIRFWDKEFEALKPKKNAKGNRRFTPEDVQNLKLIYNLVKERGYTLEGAKTYLKEQNQKSLNDFDIIGPAIFPIAWLGMSITAAITKILKYNPVLTSPNNPVIITASILKISNEPRVPSAL